MGEQKNSPLSAAAPKRGATGEMRRGYLGLVGQLGHVRNASCAGATDLTSIVARASNFLPDLPPPVGSSRIRVIANLAIEGVKAARGEG
jgi:hypothetical protein